MKKYVILVIALYLSLASGLVLNTLGWVAGGICLASSGVLSAAAILILLVREARTARKGKEKP